MTDIVEGWGKLCFVWIICIVVKVVVTMQHNIFVYNVSIFIILLFESISFELFQWTKFGFRIFDCSLLFYSWVSGLKIFKRTNFVIKIICIFLMVKYNFVSFQKCHHKNVSTEFFLILSYFDSHNKFLFLFVFVWLLTWGPGRRRPHRGSWVHFCVWCVIKNPCRNVANCLHNW